MGKIMNFSGTVLKNLFSKPVTVNYPAEPAVYPERSRGHIENDMNSCILCGLCMRSCPSGALSVDRAAGTWSIDRFDCIQCGYCTQKCPKKCLTIVPGYQEPMGEKSVEVLKKPEAETAREPETEAQEKAREKAQAREPETEAPKAAEISGK